MRKKLKHTSDEKRHYAVIPLHEDLIQDEFWERHSELLDLKPPGIFEWPEGERLSDIVTWQLDKRKGLKNELGINNCIEEPVQCK